MLLEQTGWKDDGAAPHARFVVLNGWKFDSRWNSFSQAKKMTTALGRLTNMKVWDRKLKKVVYEIDAGKVITDKQ